MLDQRRGRWASINLALSIMYAGSDTRVLLDQLPMPTILQ